MRPLCCGAFLAVATTALAPRTCRVEDVATRRVAGSFLAPFGGRSGAAHELVAVRGRAADGSMVSGLCATEATLGATVALSASVERALSPRCVLTALECACALAADGATLGELDGRSLTVLGATPEALAACELLTALGASVTVVTPRKNGADAAYAAGAAMAFHPAALDEDDEDDEDYGFVLDFVGDEGQRKGYVTCGPFDALHALDYGLGGPRPPAMNFEPVVLRIEAALAVAPDLALSVEEDKSPFGFLVDPLGAAAALALGDASKAYTEALGWPSDGETRKRYGLDLLAPSLGSVSWAVLDEALDAGDWDDDVEDLDAAPASPDAVTGDAIVFLTAKFCNSCRRMDPHYKRMQRSWGDVRFLRVDCTTDRGFAEAAGVDSTPTFLIYRGGSKIATVGTASPTVLRRGLSDAFPVTTT